jgi:flagellar basal-body rod protein FlgB
MDFAAALRQATSGGAGEMPASAGLANTQGGHLSAAGGARATSQLLYASPGQANLDRNTVDMDRERAAFADNSVKYEATLRFINSSVRTMLDAIKSPSQG